MPVTRPCSRCCARTCGLTGTKHGCELGECGACTVLVDGQPVLSCLVLPRRVRGPGDHDRRRHGRRLRAASAAGRLRRARRRAVRLLHAGHPADGQGALLEPTPTPTRDEIREALAGNLCRCTGYSKIFEAVEAGRRSQGTGERAASETDSQRHRQAAAEASTARAKVTGQRRSTPTTCSRARMLHCQLLRCPRPHARILSIDTSAARAHPGVLAVITGADLPDPVRHPAGQRRTSTRSARQGALRRRPGRGGRRGRRGDRRRGAATRSRSSTRPLEPVMSIEEALREAKDERDPRLRRPGNIHKLVALEFGDVDAGVRRGRPRLRGHLLLPGQHPPADRAARARRDYGPTGKLTLWSSHADRRTTCTARWRRCWSCR